jgi:hypothetical protein
MRLGSSESHVRPFHRIQTDDHHAQTNLAAATATRHAMRNRNIETAKSVCFLNSLTPSLIRIVRRENIERRKRKIGIAAATKAMIFRIIFHRHPAVAENGGRKMSCQFRD